MVVTRLAVVTLYAIATTRVACQDLPAFMSAVDFAKASANWNKTMEDHRQRGNLQSSGSCSSDIRKSFPACLQYEEQWCWATGVSEIAHFYKPDLFPETGSDCHGIECKIVGHKKNPDSKSECCQKGCAKDTICCKNLLGSSECEAKCGAFSSEVDSSYCTRQEEEACGALSGSATDITEAIKWIAGETYKTKIDGPLTLEELDSLMSKGHPVIIGVMWTTGGGHALTLGGCAGSGTYYLHDPEHHKGEYQTLTYEQVALYVPPEAPSLQGKWVGTWYREGDMSNDSEIVV